MATATLLCKQCNFENEPERVYCHNCGAKLDRALLPPEATKREDPQVMQNRVRAVVRPSRFALIPLLRNLAISLAVAAVLAALFLMTVAPVETPAPLGVDALAAAPAISDDLEDMVQTPTGKRLSYTEDQVNAFLQSSIRAKDDPNSVLPVKYERTFVHFAEGLCRATLQESAFGHSFYVGSTDAVEIRNGQVVTHPVGGNIGRLQLPGKIMPGVEKALATLWAPLDTYKKLVARTGAVNFHPGSVEIVGKSAGVP